MLVRVMLLISLVATVGCLKMMNAKKLPFPGGVAVAQLLKVKGEHSCSVIFVIDDSTPFSTIVNEIWETLQQQQQGTTLFQVKADKNTNMTHRLSQLMPLARRMRQLSWCSMVVVVSHDPDFLFTFAERSLKGRLLVWTTKLVVVTRLSILQVQALLSAHWTFSMMNTIFLNIKGEAPNAMFYGYTYLPYSGKGATMEKVATWTPKRGLLLDRHILPFSEKFEKFHGATVNVTGFTFMPFWGEEETKTSNGTSVIRYEGSDYKMLTAVAEALNFTIRVLPSKSWAEVTRQVEERVSFMAAVYYIIMTVRAEKYDFTQAYEFSYLSFAMAKPSQEPQWQSLYYPLAYQVWLATLGSLLLYPLTYIAVNYMERKACGGAIIAVEVIQDLSGMFLAQSLPHRLPSTSSSRVLVGTWLLFSLILGLSYRCNLTASLTIPKYPPRPETIPQLVETVDRITILPFGESHVKYYRKSKSPLFNALADLMDVGPSVLEGLQGALKYNRAHLGGRRYLKYQIAEKFTEEDGTSRLYVGRESLFPGASGWPVPHDAPYKAQVDRWILATIEAGLYEKWIADLLSETKLKTRQRQKNTDIEQQDDEKGGETESLTALTITHTQGAFILLLLGLYISSGVIIGELLGSRFSNSA